MINDRVPSDVTDTAIRKVTKRPKFSDNLECHAVLDFNGITVMVVRLSPDKKYWIAGLRNGKIMLFPTSGSPIRPTQTLRIEGDHSPCVDLDCIPSLESSSDEKNHRIVAVYASGCVRVWYYTGSTLREQLLSDYRESRMPKPGEVVGTTNKVVYNQILACACSSDAERFITGGDDGHIRVYEANGKEYYKICCSSFKTDKVDGHLMRICALKYHTRGAENPDYAHIFVSGGWDDTIQIWDDRQTHSLWMYTGPHISGSDALDVDAFSNTILTSSWRHDKTLLQVWRFNDMVVTHTTESENGEDPHNPPDDRSQQTINGIPDEPVNEIPQESIEMRSRGYVARWVGDDYIAFGGSDENIIRILSRVTSAPIAFVNDLPSGVFSMAHVPYDSEDSRKPIQMAFAAGSKVYLTRLAR